MLMHITKSPPARVVWIEISDRTPIVIVRLSPPARVVWIEIIHSIGTASLYNVATREGGVD